MQHRIFRHQESLEPGIPPHPLKMLIYVSVDNKTFITWSTEVMYNGTHMKTTWLREP